MSPETEDLSPEKSTGVSGMRASNQDREAVVRRLGAALGEGCLELEKAEERGPCARAAAAWRLPSARLWDRVLGLTRAVSRIRDLADATPVTRDRVVDAVRATAIVVVILWHWVGSLTQRDLDGSVVMPNPIAEVPGGWLATWVLNVVPLFFVVGGFANLASWDATRGNTRAFLRRRLPRLLAPVAVWVTLWLVAELVAAAVADRHRWLWQWFPGVLTPLWFVLAYVAVTAAVPLTARWHRRNGMGVLALLAGAVALGDGLARGWGVSAAGWVSGALVWVVVHQLGYVWRDRGEALGTRTRAATALAGLGALVVLTALLGYPRSMVAVQGQGESNLWPPNATVVALAVFQLGLVWLLAPAAARLLRRRRVWQPVVALNAAALTLFVWHMTAYTAVFWLAERLGLAPGDRPTRDWVLARPLWLLAPGLVLALLVAVFLRFEHLTARHGSRGIEAAS